MPSHKKQANRSKKKKLNAVSFNSVQPQGESITHASPVHNPDHHRHHLKHIHINLFLSIGVTILLMLANAWFVKQPAGERLVIAGYDIINDLRLKHFSNGADNLDAIRVVDISNMPTVSASTISTGVKEARDRRQLMELIAKIAQQKPLAIGIDVDLSKDPGSSLESGNVMNGDDQFLAFCRSIQQSGVPIYLGIHRSMNYEKSDWLYGTNRQGSEVEYSDLAASISVEKLKYKRMFLWTKFYDHDLLPSMSNRLALEYIVKHSEPGDIYDIVRKYADGKTQRETSAAATFRFEISPWVTGITMGREDTSRQCSYLIDYSYLRSLEDKRIKYLDIVNQNPASISQLKDKIILIGLADPNSTDDIKKISENLSAPGVYLHACGAATLISSHPIHELTETGRLFMDLGLSASVFLLIYVMSLLLHRKHTTLEAHKLQKHLCSAVAFIALFYGVMRSSVTGLMWDDFLIVIIALLLHPHVHYLMEIRQHIKSMHKKNILTTISEAYTKPLDTTEHTGDRKE